MLDALVSGKLIKTPELRTGKTGNFYTQFLLTVGVGSEEPIVVSGIGFGETAEKISRLQKGDALAVIGALKPSEWADKATGQLKHGLSVTVNASLSVYDISKRRAPKPEGNAPGDSTRPFNDEIPF